jgi:hypothetical protein
LDRDRQKRIGQNGDVEEVLAHPFFKGIDLKKLQNMEVPAPFLPNILDVEKLRATQQVLSFKDLKESLIPIERQNLIS